MRSPAQNGTSLQVDEVSPGTALLARLSMAPVILFFGLVLVATTWLGMRSVEQSKADVDYAHDVFESGNDLEKWIGSQNDAMSALPDTLAEGSDFQAEAVSSYLKAAGVLAESSSEPDELILYVAGISVAGDRLAVGHIIDSAGVRVADEEFIEGPAVPIVLELLRDLSEGGAIISVLDPEAAESLVGRSVDQKLALIVSKSAKADSGNAVIALVQLDTYTVGSRFLAGSAAFDVLLNDESIVSERIAPPDVERIGEGYEFEALEAKWTVVGLEGQATPDHSASWLMLLAGVLFAGAAGLLARAARSQAVVVGRLDQSAYDASHDPLTGLLNRSGLTNNLEDRLRVRRPHKLVGVLFLDLDRLKVINDSMGHSAGDEVLRIVANRLTRVIRDDDMVARFGGDEFVVISSGLPAVRDLSMLAERILTALREPAQLSDETTQMVGASIGISYVTTEDATAESLLRDADLAMYKAKESGGGRFAVFDAELRNAALARLEVERELRRAIRTGQLVVHYQPIVDVATGRVNKLEALVRWQHPERGMIPPGAFLSVAAESGLIVDVGEHVLREACRQAVVWSKATGRAVSVSVNVAERQLLDGSLVETVSRVLAETSLAPEQLELEISEELIVDRLAGNLGMLNELVDMGVRMALDDFGTGRASLSSLKQLDMVHTLKIDRAFVIDVVDDPVDRTIITAIVALAHSLGMEIVAEGIEEADQATVLKEMGVTKIQGFYFARPDTSQNVVASLTKAYDLPWEQPAALGSGD